MKIKVRMIAFEECSPSWYKTRIVVVPDAEWSGELTELCQLVFHYGQNDFQPLECYSVSMGDVIEIEWSGQRLLYWICATEVKEITEDQFYTLLAAGQLARSMSAMTGTMPVALDPWTDFVGIPVRKEQ